MSTTLDCQHEWKDTTPKPVTTFSQPNKQEKCSICGAIKQHIPHTNASGNPITIFYAPHQKMGGTE